MPQQWISPVSSYLRILSPGILYLEEVSEEDCLNCSLRLPKQYVQRHMHFILLCKHLQLHVGPFQDSRCRLRPASMVGFQFAPASGGKNTDTPCPSVFILLLHILLRRFISCYKHLHPRQIHTLLIHLPTQSSQNGELHFFRIPRSSELFLLSKASKNNRLWE